MAFHYEQTVIFIESIKSIFPFRHLWWGGVCILNFSFFWSVKINLKIESSYSKWIVLPVHLYGTFCRNRAEHKQRWRSIEMHCQRCGGLSYGAADLRWCSTGWTVSLVEPYVAPSQNLDPRLWAQGCIQHPKRFFISIMPRHVPPDAYEHLCAPHLEFLQRLLGRVCHLTMELLGNSPCCSYWGGVMKNSISIDIFASASTFF